MPLVSVTLGTELKSMEPVDIEIDAINNFANAFTKYFEGASVLGVPANPAALNSAKSAMVGSMSGLSQDGNSANAIQTGITTFWGIVSASAATIWVLAPPIISATPPPTLSTIGSILTSIFNANINGSLSLQDSAIAIANAIHPTQLGGIAILPPPPAGLGPQPIL